MEIITLLKEYGELGVIVLLFIWTFTIRDPRIRKETAAEFKRMRENHAEEIKAIEEKHQENLNTILSAMKDRSHS